MYIDFRYIYRNSLIISKSMGNVTKSFMQYLIGFAVLTAVLGHCRCIPIHSSIRIHLESLLFRAPDIILINNHHKSLNKSTLNMKNFNEFYY